MSWICGNSIIEKDEECDSGTKNDKCCGQPLSAKPCKIIQGKCRYIFIKFCSSQGQCCNQLTCQFELDTTICLMENECLKSSFCTFIIY